MVGGTAAEAAGKHRQRQEPFGGIGSGMVTRWYIESLGETATATFTA
ncbi:MAG: hypothetical protein RMJ52_18035 [Gemmataceae bacterium]|nr:hypothetical protein [Gemmataceae bacterium]